MNFRRVFPVSSCRNIFCRYVWNKLKGPDLKVALSNSGGKDCYLSMLRGKTRGLNTVVSLTMLHETLDISRSHGTPVDFLYEQADVRRMPYLHFRATWENYEQEFLKMLERAQKTFGIEGVIFGDRCFEKNRE